MTDPELMEQIKTGIAAEVAVKKRTFKIGDRVQWSGMDVGRITGLSDEGGVTVSDSPISDISDAFSWEVIERL